MKAKPLSMLRLTLNSLAHHWRINVAVALGVAAGTAVLTGALLVGDSMHGSLRDLTLGRLGRVDEVLLAPRFFRRQLAEELAADAEFPKHFREALPAVILRASLQNPRTGALVGRSTVLGVDEWFWDAGSPEIAVRPTKLPGRSEVILTQQWAD